MARPSRFVLASGIASWDADVDADFSLLFDVPFAMYQVALAGDLPAASSYDQCLALVNDVLYISNGSTWEPYQVAANVADSTATTASEMATDFNELLAALRNAGIMASS